MPKLTISVRGGVPEKLKEEVEDIISSCELQDVLFVTDIKSHSIDFFIDNDQVGTFINQVKVRYNLSIIKQGQINQLGDYIVAFGKLQDSGVVKTIQSQAQGLFK